MRESGVIQAQTIQFDANESFAAYSMPGSIDYNLVYQLDKQHTHSCSSEHSAFVISPFTLESTHSQFIIADEILSNVKFECAVSSVCQVKSTSHNKYLNDVSQIISDIDNGLYQKLVYSRVINKDLGGMSVYDIFQRLVNSYKNAFVFCYNTPETGCWLGATPELLVSKAVEAYRTLALAGTQVDMGISLDQVKWGQKEQDEQYFLRAFIQDRLGVNHIEHIEIGTRTVRAGHVLHIATEFEIDESAELLDIAQILHPGPAICGTPQAVAYDYIQRYESHNRDSYCGFIGPMNISKDSALYVNLRSMAVFKDQVSLYVGGGITKDSIPEDEWAETENKSRTLLDVIQKSYNH